MTLLAWIGPIAESGPIMQQGMIVNELHVTRLEPHAKMQSGAVCERVKEIERLQDSIHTKRSNVVRPFIKFDLDKPSGRDVLRVEGLSKRFGEKRIFEGLSFNLDRGDNIRA